MITKVYTEAKRDVISYMKEGLRMRGDKETKEFWDTKKTKLKTKLEEVLETLTNREREIIKLRYGLWDGYTYTLEEVGGMFLVNRERVRQIEAKAIRKLQHPIRSKMLEGFLGGHQEDKPSIHALEGLSNYTPEQRDLIFKSSVQDFELSVRTQNVLKNLGLKTIGDLCNVSEMRLLSYKNCGETTLREIKETLLKPYGLDLKKEEAGK